MAIPDINEEFASLLRGVKRTDRPEVGALYSKLADLTARPVDLSPLKAVAAANKQAASRDFLGGLALSTLGGKRMSPIGKELANEGIARGKPLRPNAADVGYENSETGEIIANPLTQHSQDIKSTEAQIKGVEAADAKEMAVAQRLLQTAVASGDKERADQIRLLIAEMMAESRRYAADRAADRAAAKAKEKETKANEPPSKIQVGLVENQANYDFIDAAIAEGDKNPEAFGLKTFLPSEIVSRTDEEGVTPRAFVQNIASLKIHDRSGAAVTAAEFPRLKAFIPIAGDDWPTLKKKLRGFQREYGLMKDAIARGWPNSALVANLDKRPGAKPPVTAPAPQAPRLPSPEEIAAELARRNAQ